MANFFAPNIFDDIATPDSPISTSGVELPRRLIASKQHTIIALLILTALNAWSYYRAQQLLASGEMEHRVRTYLLSIAGEWAIVGYIAWGVKRAGGSLRTLIGGRWAGAGAFFKDVGIAAVFWVASLIILGLTKVLLHLKDQSEVLKLLAPHNGLEMFLWVLVAFTAGICEEIIFRGYLQQQFTGWSNRVSVGLGMSVLFFGAGHIYQGVKSAIGITVFGLLFSLLAHYRKSLRPGMMAHAWQDTLAGLALRYLVK